MRQTILLEQSKDVPNEMKHLDSKTLSRTREEEWTTLRYNKIRTIQRRAYGLRDEEYLRLKILTSTLPPW